MPAYYEINKYENVKNSIIIIANSTIFYIFSYVFIYFVTQIATILAAATFKIPTVLYFYKIDFLIRASDWWFEQVWFVFSIGPIIALIIGILFLIIYSHVFYTDGLLKMFFLWGFVHGITMSIGAASIGSFVNQGFGNVERWLYFDDTILLFIALAGMTSIMFLGLLCVKLFLFSANSYYNVQKPEFRMSFILNQFLFPWLLGSLLLILLKIPFNLYEINDFNIQYDTLILLSGLFFILPFFGRIQHFPEIYFDEEARKITLEHKFLLIVLFIILLLRIGLNNGIRI